MIEASPAAVKSIVQGISPDYVRNRDQTGNRVEFLRPIQGAVQASHNYLRRSYRAGENTYFHCFCLTLLTKSNWYMCSPLVIGTRFDRNDRLRRQMVQEGFEDKGVFDTHSGHATWYESISKSMQVVEEKLLPIYVDRLRRHAETFGRAIDYAIKVVELADRPVPAMTAASLKAVTEWGEAIDLPVTEDNMEGQHVSLHLTRAAGDAFGISDGDLLAGWRLLVEKVNSREWPVVHGSGPGFCAALALYYRKEFAEARDRLPDMSRSLAEWRNETDTDA